MQPDTCRQFRHPKCNACFVGDVLSGWKLLASTVYQMRAQGGWQRHTVNRLRTGIQRCRDSKRKTSLHLGQQDHPCSTRTTHGITPASSSSIRDLAISVRPRLWILTQPEPSLQTLKTLRHWREYTFMMPLSRGFRHWRERKKVWRTSPFIVFSISLEGTS
jgi:hypothetical protein